MADELPEKVDHDMVERTCRIVMNVRVRVREITPDNVAGYFAPDETGEGLTWDWAERQNRLLSALLKDEESLDKFLIGIIRCDLELLIDTKQVADDLADEEEERLFERVFSRMSSGDVLFFREAMRDGLFPENIELLDKAFMIDWKKAEIRDVSVVKQDIVKG